MFYTPAQAATLAASLQDLEQSTPQHFTPKALVQQHAAQIRSLRKAGHSWETIAATFAGAGIELPVSTLRRYVHEERPKQKRSKRRRPDEAPPASEARLRAEDAAPDEEDDQALTTE